LNPSEGMYHSELRLNLFKRGRINDAEREFLQATAMALFRLNLNGGQGRNRTADAGLLIPGS